VVEATDLRGDTTLFMELQKVIATVFVQILQKTGRITKQCKKLTLMTSDRYKADGTNLLLSTT
jgi:histone H3/H4